MADDRMLSDEILLGIINSKSGGGGGGGTSNYNDLSNKPQIGGVTLSGDKSASDLGLVAAENGKGLSTNDYTDADKAIVGGVTEALADKADKSAVKNEFIGTLEQWNALTEEQKKAYDTYQITDDYTEGSGGLLNYSTTEQKTGQKWIDGKDIYFKTLHIVEQSEINRKSYTTEVTSLSIDKIIKLDAMVKLGTSGGGSWYTSPFYYDTTKQTMISATNNLLNIYSDGWNFTEAYVTLYYTKTA